MPPPSGPKAGEEGLLEQSRLDLAKEVLQRFGHVRIRMQGTSMLPSIWPGDIVEIVRADVTSLRNGDVVLLESGDKLLCHRIRAIEFTGADPHVRTRGDHLSHDDPVASAASILGRVATSVEPAPFAAAALRLVSRVSQRPISWLVRAHTAR